MYYNCFLLVLTTLCQRFTILYEIFNGFCLFLATSANFMLLFIIQESFHFFFYSCSEMPQLHHLLWCHVTGTCALLIFFTYIALFKFTILSYKSNVINNFRKTIVKFIIIKINIIKFYTIKTYIIAKDRNNIRVYITKDYIIIIKYSIINFLNYFTKSLVFFRKYFIANGNFLRIVTFVYFLLLLQSFLRVL